MGFAPTGKAPPLHGAHPIEAMGEAYELLLEKALHKAHQSGTLLHHVIEERRCDAVALNKFSDNEIVMLEEYVRRDLIDTARFGIWIRQEMI